MATVLACVILLQHVFLFFLSTAAQPTTAEPLVGVKAFIDQAAQSTECQSYASIIDTLMKTHSIHNPPGEKTTVKMELWVQNVLGVCDFEKDIELDLYASETWFDPGLKFDHLNPCKPTITLNEEYYRLIWTPKVTFVNSKQVSVHESPFKNVFVLIYPNGTVWTTLRMRVKAPCKQHLSRFPMDSQNCSLMLESYRYSADVVHVQWKDIPNPIIMFSDVEITGFMLQSIDAKSDQPVYPAGKWDTLTAILTFKRKIGYYVLHAYIPSYFIMIISWVPFALGKSTAARAVLGAVSLLAMMMIYSNITIILPRISYATAFDVWTLGCVSFIVLSLIELGIVEALSKEPSDAIKIRAGAQYSGLSGTRPKGAAIADLIDKISVFAFPTLFAVFNIAYWACYA